jgi:hypothetical protein
MLDALVTQRSKQPLFSCELSRFSFSFFFSSYSLEFEAIYVTQLGIYDSLSQFLFVIRFGSPRSVLFLFSFLSPLYLSAAGPSHSSDSTSLLSFHSGSHTRYSLELLSSNRGSTELERANRTFPIQFQKHKRSGFRNTSRQYEGLTALV